MDSSFPSSPSLHSNHDDISVSVTTEKQFIDHNQVKQSHHYNNNLGTQSSSLTVTNDTYDEENSMDYNLCRQNSYNPYATQSRLQDRDKNDFVVPQLSTNNHPRTFEETLQYNQKLKDTASHVPLPLMKRKSHSNKDEVNAAFQDHQKAFKRKNRAIDWVLAQKIPDIDQVTNDLNAKLQQTVALSEEDQTISPYELINKHWGNQFEHQKEPRHTQLFFQNIRGLQTSKRNNQDKWNQLLEYVVTNNIDLIGIAETCTNTTRHRIRHLLQRTAQKVFNQANLNWSTNDFQTDTNYRPGGYIITYDRLMGRTYHTAT